MQCVVKREKRRRIHEAVPAVAVVEAHVVAAVDVLETGRREVGEEPSALARRVRREAGREKSDPYRPGCRSCVHRFKIETPSAALFRRLSSHTPRTPSSTSSNSSTNRAPPGAPLTDSRWSHARVEQVPPGGVRQTGTYRGPARFFGQHHRNNASRAQDGRVG